MLFVPILLLPDNSAEICLRHFTGLDLLLCRPLPLRIGLEAAFGVEIWMKILSGWHRYPSLRRGLMPVDQTGNYETQDWEGR